MVKRAEKFDTSGTRLQIGDIKSDSVVRVSLKSFDHQSLYDSASKIVELAKRLECKVKGPVPQPVRKRKFIVLTSPNVDKNAREQYEIREHKLILDLYDVTSSFIEALSKINLLSSIDVTIKVI